MSMEDQLEYIRTTMVLREQRREGYDEGRVDTLVNSVSALVEEMGWSHNEAMDRLRVPKEDRAIVIERLES